MNQSPWITMITWRLYGDHPLYDRWIMRWIMSLTNDLWMIKVGIDQHIHGRIRYNIGLWWLTMQMNHYESWSIANCQINFRLHPRRWVEMLQKPRSTLQTRCHYTRSLFATDCQMAWIVANWSWIKQICVFTKNAIFCHQCHLLPYAHIHGSMWCAV